MKMDAFPRSSSSSHTHRGTYPSAFSNRILHSPPEVHRMTLPLSRLVRLLALAFLIALAGGYSVTGQQTTAEQQATMLLASARRAYNEKNYAFATARFKEFLT